MRRFTLGALGAAVLVLVLAACGSSSSSSPSSSPSASGSSTPSSTTASGGSFKVGLVTDIGGLNDKGFNHLAYTGLLLAEHQLGIGGTVLQSTSGADYVPNLTKLAQGGNKLVISVGFLMAQATAQVAKQFPNVHFAIIDNPADMAPDNLKNIEGLLFREQQAGYLVGYLAGLYSKAHGYKTISSVGGQKIPPVDHYIAGYQAGAKAADPGIKTLNGYSQDFVAQDKCKNLGLNQIQQGSKVVFQVAGACGLGALSAAQAQGAQGIGVDADQAYLGSYILTSAEKRVDLAVFNAIKAAMGGTFTGAANVFNDATNGGIGYGKIGSAGTQFAAQIAKVFGEIKSGQIANIPSTVP
ncbi:MAG TPA: BMP family ABC transporter substrate-binding protein [Solirubrobacteraceae bacterium]